MQEKTIYNFGKDLVEFIKGELTEQFPEISPTVQMTGDGKIQIITHGRSLEEERKDAILKAITDKFLKVRKFIVGLDDKFNLSAALKHLQKS